MPWTKQEIISEAFAEIGLGAVAYALDPADVQTGMRRLNAMMSQWSADGLDVGYTVIDGTGEGDATDDSEIRMGATRAVVLNLAIELAPGYGKTPLPRTIADAKGAKARLFGAEEAIARVPDYTAVPLGAGHKRRGAINMAPDE